MKCVRTLAFRPNENYRSGLKIDKVFRSAWFMDKVCGVWLFCFILGTPSSVHFRASFHRTIRITLLIIEATAFEERTSLPKTMFTNWITLTESLLFGVCLRVWWWWWWWCCYWQRPFLKTMRICLRSIVWCACLNLKDWTHGLPLNGQAHV